MFVLWYRPTRTQRWRAVADAPSYSAAGGRINSAGDWYVGSPGRDPNAPTQAEAQMKATGREQSSTPSLFV